MKKYTCKKCNHSWLPRTDKKPKECPNCKSRGWEGTFVSKKRIPNETKLRVISDYQTGFTWIQIAQRNNIAQRSASRIISDAMREEAQKSN